MKLYEVLEFRALYEKIKSIDLPVRLSYKFLKFFRKIQDEIDFYQKEQFKILDEFGIKDEKGNLEYTEDKSGVKIKEGTEEICHKKMEELLNLDIEIKDVNFSLDELEQLNLSLEDLNCLMQFIEE
jgi:hypothetical protein